VNLNFPTGVCIFCGQSPSESTTAQSPLGTLATSVTQATRPPPESPASPRFTPLGWPLFGNEERKFPPDCVILPPTASSLAVAAAGRAAAALGQLYGMPPATQFRCPNELLRYGYNLLRREPVRDNPDLKVDRFFQALKAALNQSGLNYNIPEVLVLLIRSYIHIETPLNPQISVEKWAEYLQLDEATTKDLKTKLASINKSIADGKADELTQFFLNALNNALIKIIHIMNSLNESTSKEHDALEQALKQKMREIIDLIVNPQGSRNFLGTIGRILCEIEGEDELLGNREIPYFEPLVSIALIQYASSIMLRTASTTAPLIDINMIFRELGVETNPDFLLRSDQFRCGITMEEFHDHYDPVHFFITHVDATLLRKAVLKWAIKYYNLNQYEIVNGQIEYGALTQALCENPEDLETQEGIEGIQIRLKREAMLFLLQAVRIIRRTTGEKK